ncbi:hypothetical protein CMU77_11255 [Elizabethkingia anophelis]|nr:hypothetical protein [Elizabethkingia anophelis]
MKKQKIPLSHAEKYQEGKYSWRIYSFNKQFKTPQLSEIKIHFVEKMFYLKKQKILKSKH